MKPVHSVIDFKSSHLKAGEMIDDPRQDLVVRKVSRVVESEVTEVVRSPTPTSQHVPVVTGNLHWHAPYLCETQLPEDWERVDPTETELCQLDSGEI